MYVEIEIWNGCFEIQQLATAVWCKSTMGNICMGTSIIEMEYGWNSGMECCHICLGKN